MCGRLNGLQGRAPSEVVCGMTRPVSRLAARLAAIDARADAGGGGLGLLALTGRLDPLRPSERLEPRFRVDGRQATTRSRGARKQPAASAITAPIAPTIRRQANPQCVRRPAPGRAGIRAAGLCMVLRLRENPIILIRTPGRDARQPPHVSYVVNRYSRPSTGTLML